MTKSHLEALIEVEKSKSNISMLYLQNQINRLFVKDYSVTCDAPYGVQRPSDDGMTVTVDETSSLVPFVPQKKVLDGKRNCLFDYDEMAAYGFIHIPSTLDEADTQSICEPASIPSSHLDDHAEILAKDSIQHAMLTHFLQNPDDVPFEITQCLSSSSVCEFLKSKFGCSPEGIE